MKRTMTSGVCQLCKEVVGKAAMTRHLTKCLKEHATSSTAVSKAASSKVPLFHLLVQGRYNPQYWIHVEIPGTATLADLDAFLRQLWLECCGHLSTFIIGGTHFSVDAGGDDPFGSPWEDRGMEVPVGKLLGKGLKFTHEYDFGSTTELELKVVGEREGAGSKKEPVRLLARNEPPLIPCSKCGKPSDWVHSWEDMSLCKKCADFDEDEWEEGFLPVVNSPRVGVCGYTG
jgi:hypothetical protein